MDRPSREPLTTAMPTVPEGLKNNVRAVLISQAGGVLLTEFERDYRELVKSTLKYKALGFETLEEFIRSIPDAARMEYSSRDCTMRIFGIAKPGTYINKVMKKAQGRIPPSHLKEIQNHDHDQNGPSQEDTSVNGIPVLPGTKHVAVSGRSKQKRNVNSEPAEEYAALEPDERGWYTICFPEERVPQGEVIFFISFSPFTAETNRTPSSSSSAPAGSCGSMPVADGDTTLSHCSWDVWGLCGINEHCRNRICVKWQ